ncbi:MAG: dienelactone hydrolase family protein [Actinomycetes bacterium]
MGERVTFASNGDTCEGYLAAPAAGHGPAVIVVQEWWGLVPHIEEVTDRFADAGFVALAPDFYHGVATDEPDEAMRLLMGLAIDRAARDLAGAADYLGAREDVDGTGIGSVGFCMGGSLSLWSGTLADNIVAAVGFYPAVPWHRMSPDWTGYAGKAALIHCSEEDGTSAAEGIVAAVRGIESAGGSVEVYDYPGTQHAFFNDHRPEVHAPEASALAWDRTLAFLRAHLTG